MPRPITPAPEVQQTVSYPTPQLIDRHLLDRWSTNEADYQPIQPGTPHPNSRDFAGYFLLKELPIDPSNPNWVIRVWSNGYEAQDTYAFETKYAEGDIAYPLFSRTYLELRSDYTPLPKLQPLTGIYSATVLIRGNNYEQSAVTATVTGTGTGADILPIVGTDGGIDHLVVRNPGTGYTGTPTVTFGGGGFGATATLNLQPATCLLTSEEQVRADDTNDWMYVKVRRVYETLPGPEVATLHFDPQTFTERTTYEQRVAIGTLPNPVAAVQIFQVAVGSPAVVTTMKPHGIPIGDTFDVRFAGTTGGTPDPDGDHVATSTGTGTFTIPLNVTVATSQFTGFVSVMKGGQVILDSYIKPDEDSGTVVGTLNTLCATLPGREVSSARYDTERAAFVTEYRQFVHLGFGDWFALGTYRGQTIEDSNEDPKSAGLALLTTRTILLPGNAITTLGFDEALGVVRKTIKTRVAIGSSADSIGGAPTPTSAGFFTTQSKIVAENSVVGVKITQQLNRPLGWTETVSGSEPMPNIFIYLGPWTIGNTNFYEQGPFLGVNYALQKHSVASPLLCAHSFTWGEDNTVFSTFAVISGRSRYFPIDGLTLHSTYSLIEINPTTAASQTIEAMFQSDPAPGSYVTGTLVLVNVTNEPYEGGPDGLWLRRSYFARCT